MPPKRYIEKLFKKSAKLSRSIAPLRARMAETEQNIKSAEEQLYFINLANITELKEAALFKKSARQNVKGRENIFKTYRYKDSLIYLGRGSLSNSALLSKFANAGDLWLHAHDIPSAHCIVRGSSPADRDTLLYAASLVAASSKNREELAVEVDYTLRKHVKQPKGAPPGFVIYSNYKTVRVKPLQE